MSTVTGRRFDAVKTQDAATAATLIHTHVSLLLLVCVSLSVFPLNLNNERRRVTQTHKTLTYTQGWLEFK